MKRECAMIFFFLIVFLLSGCQSPLVSLRHPINNANTEWRSTDGSVVFRIEDDYSVRGTIRSGCKQAEIFIMFHFENSLSVYPIELIDKELLEPKDQYEVWDCEYLSRKHFVATVVYSTFFEVGQVFDFYKT